MKNFIYYENGWRWFEAEQLPVKPKMSDCVYWETFDANTKYYNSELSALKAKSLPVWNAELIRHYIFDDINSSDITDKKEFYEWPGPVEVKEVLGPGFIPSYNEAILKLP